MSNIFRFCQYCPILCNIVQNCQILPNTFQYFSNGYFSSLYSELVFIHYLIPVTSYLLLATCYLTTVTYHLLLATCYLTTVTCYMLLATCYLLYVTYCYLIHAIWFHSIWSWVVWSLLFLAKKFLPFAPVVRLALVLYCLSDLSKVSMHQEIYLFTSSYSFKIKCRFEIIIAFWFIEACHTQRIFKFPN